MTKGRRRTPASDDELLEGLRAGDEEAFVALVSRHNHALFWVVRSFVPSDAIAEEVADEEVADASSLAKVALTTMLEVQHVYVGLHQGDIGHLADHAHGLLVLDRLGYRNAALRGRSGFRQHLAAIRRVRYLTADLVEVRHGLDADPREHQYWDQSWSGNDWAFGHAFKYPYAFLDLLEVAGDDDLASPTLNRLGELVAES